MSESVMSPARRPDVVSGPRARWWRLSRRGFETVAAMTVGALVLGTVRELVGLTVPFGAPPGTSTLRTATDMLGLGTVREVVGLTVPFGAPPGTAILLTATDMAIGVVAWRRLRAGAWAGTVETCAAMYAPAILVPPFWRAIGGTATVMVTGYVVVLVTALAVLLRRRG